MVSGVTSPLRFPGSLNLQLQDFQTNLVPYPRLHFPLVAFSPFVHCDNVRFEPLGTGELVKQSFSPGNQMIKVDPRSGKYISCILFLRGDVSPQDVNTALGQVKQMPHVQFVDYSPTGFKVSSN